MTKWHSITSWGGDHRYLVSSKDPDPESMQDAIRRLTEGRHGRNDHKNKPSPRHEEPVMSVDVDTAYNLVQEAVTKKKVKDFRLERERKYFLTNRRVLWTCLVAMVSMLIMSVTLNALFGIAAFFFLAMSAMFTFSGVNMINKIDQIKIDQIKIDLEIERATNRFLRLEEEERNYNAGL